MFCLIFWFSCKITVLERNFFCKVWKFERKKRVSDFKASSKLLKSLRRFLRCRIWIFFKTKTKIHGKKIYFFVTNLFFHETNTVNILIFKICVPFYWFFFLFEPFFWPLSRGGGLKAFVDCPLRKITFFAASLMR